MIISQKMVITNFLLFPFIISSHWSSHLQVFGICDKWSLRRDCGPLCDELGGWSGGVSDWYIPCIGFVTDLALFQNNG